MHVNQPNRSPEFSGLGLYLWPIPQIWAQKAHPYASDLLFISFNYNILRTLKEYACSVCAGIRSRVIPFIKVWAMFPGTLVMTFLFTRLSINFQGKQFPIFSSRSFFSILTVCHRYLSKSRYFGARCTTASLQQLLHMLQMANFMSEIGFSQASTWCQNCGAISSFSSSFGDFANQVTRLNEAKRSMVYSVLGKLLRNPRWTSFCFLAPQFWNGADLRWYKMDKAWLLLVSLVIVAGMLVYCYCVGWTKMSQ